MRWSTVRYPVIVLLVALIPTGLWLCWQNVGAGWQAGMRDNDAYLHAPGCFPPKPDDPQDPSLPPCVRVPGVVVGISTHQERSEVNASGVRTAFDLAVRDGSGNVHQYYDVWDNFASGRRTGEVVSLKCWNGLIEEIDAGGDHYLPTPIPVAVSSQIEVGFVWLLMAVLLAPALIRLVIVLGDRRRNAFE